MLDTARHVATPEGIEISLRVAGPVPRALAYLIDLSIRAAIMFGLSLAISALGQFGMAVFLLTAFFLEWLYPVFFEVLASGATPGKRSMGLIVLNDRPVNAETPAHLLDDRVTPASRLFVRNNGVPVIYLNGSADTEPTFGALCATGTAQIGGNFDGLIDEFS